MGVGWGQRTLVKSTCFGFTFPGLKTWLILLLPPVCLQELLCLSVPQFLCQQLNKDGNSINLRGFW